MICDAKDPGGHRRRDGRGADRDFRRPHATCWSRRPSSIRCRSATRPGHSTCTAIRRIVSSGASTRRARLGQPPLLRVDSRISRRQTCRRIVDVGQPPPRREPIVLRSRQLQADSRHRRARRIACARFCWHWAIRKSTVVSGQWLSNAEGGGRRAEDVDPTLPNPQSPIPNPSSTPPSHASRPTSLAVVPPSWRRDLTREIDLIEEVGADSRLRGDSRRRGRADGPFGPAPAWIGCWSGFAACSRPPASTRRSRSSAVDEKASAAMSPWTEAEPLRSQMPVIRGADCLRRSLLPSLLEVRRTNEALANAEIELFEIARAYLAA